MSASAHKLVTAPAVEPISIAEAKANSRLGFDDNTDDSVVLETGAVAYVSVSTFTVTGDKRAVYSHGRYLVLTQTASDTGYVAAAPTYDAGTGKTTVVFSGTVDSGLTAVSYGDGHLSRAIQAARAAAEAHQNRNLITQTQDVYFEAWPVDAAMPLPVSPLQSITSLKYTDSEGIEHTVDTADYSADTVSIRPRLVLKYGKSWPSVTLASMLPIVVRVVAGYGDTGETVPYSTRAGMLLLIGTLYEHREDIITGISVSKMPRSAEHQLDMEAIREVC